MTKFTIHTAETASEASQPVGPVEVFYRKAGLVEAPVMLNLIGGKLRPWR